MLVGDTCCLRGGDVAGSRGCLWRPVVLPEEDRFARAEWRLRCLCPSVFVHWALVF